MEWKGIFPALTTPFNDQDALDLDMFKKNTRFQIDAGVDGLIISGSLGETSTLTKEERDILTTLAVDEYGKEVHIVVNIAEQSTREAVAVAQSAEEKGAHPLFETVALSRTVQMSRHGSNTVIRN